MGAAGFGGPHMRNDLSDRVESGNLLEGDPARIWDVQVTVGRVELGLGGDPPRFWEVQVAIGCVELGRRLDRTCPKHNHVASDAYKKAAFEFTAVGSSNRFPGIPIRARSDRSFLVGPPLVCLWVGWCRSVVRRFCSRCVWAAVGRSRGFPRMSI